MRIEMFPYKVNGSYNSGIMWNNIIIGLATRFGRRTIRWDFEILPGNEFAVYFVNDMDAVEFKLTT